MMCLYEILLQMSISSPLVLWLWDIHKWSPANYRGQVTRSSGDIALAGRAAVLFMTPLKLRKFQLYTIINFLRYFYKLRSRNKVGMDDDARSGWRHLEAGGGKEAADSWTVYDPVRGGTSAVPCWAGQTSSYPDTEKKWMKTRAAKCGIGPPTKNWTMMNEHWNQTKLKRRVDLCIKHLALKKNCV